MATNKRYLIVGATYNGDGTTTAAAASNGGVGAWNQESITTGTAPTYGTLPADTDVYIRSKNASEANFSWLVGAATNFGSANATSAGPINWIIDGGTKWSGVQGQVKHYRTGNFTLTIRSYNNIIAEQVGRYLVSDEYASTSIAWYIVANTGGVTLENVEWDYTAVTFSSTGPYFLSLGGASGSQSVRVINPKATCGNRRNTTGGFVCTDYGALYIVNPTIIAATAHASPIFGIAGLSTRLRVEGGSLSGAGMTNVASLLGTPGTTMGGTAEFFGVDIPKPLLPIYGGDVATVNGCEYRIEGIGLDGGGMGGFRYTRVGFNTSRSDTNHPYLNAAYPGAGASGWSWRCYPYGCDLQRPHEVPMHFAFTDTAATRKITVELLVSDAGTPDFHTLLTKGNTWIDVTYWDNASGGVKYETTRITDSTTALDTSTSSWSSTTWGSFVGVKRKIELTTSYSIKSGSIVNVVLRTTVRSVTSDDIFFVDPGIQVSAP